MRSIGSGKEPKSLRRRVCYLLLFAALELPAQDPGGQVEDPAVVQVRAKLAEADAARERGDHEHARSLVRAALAECVVLNGLVDHENACDLLWRIGQAACRVADTRAEHDAYECLCVHLAHTLPNDHMELQRARSNLATAKSALGDRRGALQLRERVLEVWNRTLPDDHPALQHARGNLALSMWELGDLAGALALQERILEVLSRKLSDEHPDLLRAQSNLAITKREFGDLQGAHALVAKVFEVRSRTLPDEHADLQSARTNLSLVKTALGDLAGARVLRQKVYEVLSRTLPDDHPDLQRGRGNLASIKAQLGDLVGARVLRQKVYEVLSRKLPDDHPDLQAARLGVAASKKALGDLVGAIALEEKVLEVWSRTLPDDHPDLQLARRNLANTTRARGDLAVAHELQEKVLEVLGRTLPGDHPDLQAVRGNLAFTSGALGDADGALELARARGNAARRRLSRWFLAPRELGAMAAQEQAGVDLLLSLVGGFGAIEAQPEAASQALVLAQTLRGAQTRAARRMRAVDPVRAGPLMSALNAAAAEVTRVAGEAVETEDAELEAKRRDRAERLSRVVHEKERIERELAALAAKAGHVATVSAGAADLAAALPDHSAAAAIVGFTHHAVDPEHPGRTSDEARLAALILARSGEVTFCPLGPRTAIEDLVTELRTQVGAGRERGLSPRGGEDPLAVQKALRARVLDPIVALAGDIDTLWLSVDEALELVPLDALARDDGTPLGEKLALRPLVSLFDLLEPAGAEVGDEPALLAIGGLDYDQAGDAPLAVLGEAAAPPTDDTRSGRRDNFRKLLDSSTEVRTIAATFGETFAHGKVELLRKTEAGKAALLAAAPGATFVHLATHGYFAPETVKSIADQRAGEGTITGLSPLVLCGLALSGANLPPDDLGRHAGILTAEEILSLDLSKCFLVALSACDTSLGVRRAGQGYASLRAALQGAGARYVLTSLWKVGDEATMELMSDFYRRLWVRKQEPHRALWEAKLAARQQGASFRDWAGWVLTGR